MRRADFGLAGKFDFALSGTVQIKSLHIHISKKPPLISRLRNIKGGCRRQPDMSFHYHCGERIHAAVGKGAFDGIFLTVKVIAERKLIAELCLMQI